MNYQKLNLIFGWLTFAIATFVFVSTIEPTASFWDCGEYIASAYKLEVGHPPGAPLFMMLGRLFSIFASPEKVAMTINILSALCSSFTILFLFWTITALGRKLALLSGELSKGMIAAIIGSGLVGGLAYTFSDSFWFSAVEGEVYAMSSLFTAVVFWAILKWERVADEQYATRWIILIAFLMGLSIGVHLLNLLAIPAITFVCYFKKYQVTRNGLIITGILSVFILVVVQYGIIPGVVILATGFELLFVNSFGMPFNSGVVIYLLLLTGIIIMGLLYTNKYRNKQLFYAFTGAIILLIIIGLGYSGTSILAIFFILVLLVSGLVYLYIKEKLALLNIILLCFTVILIGYSSFALIAIRSNANPPMDENNPENVFALLSYLNREQYGDRPLGYGHYFNSPINNKEPYVDGKPAYFQDKAKGKYIVSDDRKKSIPNYAPEFCSVFPRMYSSDSKHVRQYKKWSEFKGKPIRYRTIQGEDKIINKPTMWENLRFFRTYQLGWMYGRYFMWNFAGRQNDLQGHGSILQGNWLSGIPFIDNARLGSQDNLPESLANNKARNQFYFLPLLLGLIGVLYQFGKSRKDGVLVTLLFFFTGIAVVIYLNQYPIQPRERDYAYAASFYAYSIWIGLGVLGLFELLRQRINAVFAAGSVTIICLFAVPGIMAKDGWDDHDRSGTYTARDFAKDYLDTCAPNAILFTNGDNDTFPLWYVQEVEEYRTDVRVVNLSLLNTDWYINQMRRAAYDSKPVPFAMPEALYRQGTRDYVPINVQPKLFLKQKYNSKKGAFAPKYKALLNLTIDALQRNQLSNSGEETKVLNQAISTFIKFKNGNNSSYKNVEEVINVAIGLSNKENISKYKLDSEKIMECGKLARELKKTIESAPLPLDIAMNFITDEKTQAQYSTNRRMNYFPTKDFSLKVDSAKVLANGTVLPEMANRIVPALEWKINKSYILKNDMMILDLLANNKWERPIYFAITTGNDSYIGLEDYFRLEGLAYRLVPYKAKSADGQTGQVYTETMYNNLMNKFQWGGMDKGEIYLNENNRRMCMNLRNNFARLADALLREGKKEKALEVLDRCLEVMPDYNVPYNYFMMPITEMYYKAGATDKANALTKRLADIYTKELNYYCSLSAENYRAASKSAQQAMSVIYRMNLLTNKTYPQEELGKEIKEKFEMLQTLYAEKEQEKEALKTAN